MYRVYMDYDHSTKSGKIMHSPELAAEGFVLIDPKCTRELNGAGELTFSVAKDHPYRYAFTRMKTIFTVVWVDDSFDETSLWQGRCYSDETDQYGTCSVTCEGEYAYLNDTMTFYSDPDKKYEPEDDEEEIDVRIPLWMYVAGLIAEHNASCLNDKQFMFDAIVDISDIKSSMDDYIDYTSTWLAQSGATMWVYNSSYIKNTANWVHVYLTTNTENWKYSVVTMIAVPDNISEWQIYHGMDVEPKDDPTVELNITSHTNHKQSLESLPDDYGGYINVTDHWVHFERRTQYEQQHDTDDMPYRTPFVETEGVGKYMPVITYLREPGEYIDYTKLTFGQEISELSVNAECDEVINVLIPTASEQGEEDDADYWDGTLKSINDNVEYITADTSIDTFGWIWGNNDWGEEVTDADTLMVRAISYLEEHMAPKWTIDMKVVDPSFTDLSKDALHYGNRYPVYVAPLDIDTSFILIKEVLNLVNPSKNSYEFYTTIGVFTDVELQNGGKDEYRMNAAFGTYREGFVEKYSTETSGFYMALKAAMDQATPIPIEIAYGANRVDFNNSTYLTASEEVAYNGTTYLCNMYYCYPTVAPWCRNTPYGSASFILIVLYNSSTGHHYQVAFNPFSYTYILYRQFNANNVQVKSNKKVGNTTNTRNWSHISGANWPDPSSGTKTGSITIYLHPEDIAHATGEYPEFTCAATTTASGLTYAWQVRYGSYGTWVNVASRYSRYWSGYNTDTLTSTTYTSPSLVGYQFRCAITDSTGTKAYTNVAKIT